MRGHVTFIFRTPETRYATQLFILYSKHDYITSFCCLISIDITSLFKYTTLSGMIANNPSRDIYFMSFFRILSFKEIPIYGISFTKRNSMLRKRHHQTKFFDSLFHSNNLQSTTQKVCFTWNLDAECSISIPDSRQCCILNSNEYLAPSASINCKTSLLNNNSFIVHYIFIALHQAIRTI